MPLALGLRNDERLAAQCADDISRGIANLKGVVDDFSSGHAVEPVVDVGARHERHRAVLTERDGVARGGEAPDQLIAPIIAGVGAVFDERQIGLSIIN